MKTYNERELAQFTKDSPILNTEANSDADITKYFMTMVKAINAANQQYASNLLVHLHRIQFKTQYAVATLSIGNKEYQSYYVRKEYRGLGIFRSLCIEANSRRETILTTPSCNIESILGKYSVSHEIVWSVYDTSNYSAIKTIINVYGERAAVTSKMPWIYHIFEGFTVLRQITDNTEVFKAFALHPIMQTMLPLYIKHIEKTLSNSNSKINAFDLLNAAKYSHAANSFLYKDFTAYKVIDESLIEDDVVRLALVADKIQNLKDFNIHHSGNGVKPESYKEYFELWLDTLTTNDKDCVNVHLLEELLISPLNAVELNIDKPMDYV